MSQMPDCKTLRSKLDDLLDGALPRPEAEALERHIAGCPACEATRADAEGLRAALRAMPVPGMRPGFAQAALAAAVAQDAGRKQAAVPAPREARRRTRRFGFMPWPASPAWPWLGAAAGAVAAGLLVVALWGLPQDAVTPVDSVPQAAELTLALYEPRDIAIAIDAEQAMPGARLTVRLAGGIELVGFGDTRELSWETDLDQGTNMLSLPVLAHSLEQGRLTALVEHGERRQQIELAIRTDAPESEKP
ncbi:anti-sigma factor [Thioalkalivibrio sp. XN279]|uniref:anti-sigma factor family protein n=1 Tax=Thioalkalivibrio sp. XN279 TaxID=2714953 RepID=UPI00140E082B|nr:zf-HC2 domain-containing protein [Thioalkalivibrio sp. XN279]NHA15509.1 zf-HC2 domain-containing protein [Thioalkalivibrio sp. XN279]